MTTEAAKKAKAKYDARTAKYISLKLNQNTDRDIIEFLELQENTQGYLKRLIREDMAKLPEGTIAAKHIKRLLESAKNKTAHE